jgi:phospholipid/cholesterol/gamma-HCH transport system substrate-binding protein
MEIRARYVLIGFFTLAVIAAGFLFIYWLYNGSGFGEVALYRVRFLGSVPGLASGSPVTFNGLRVGEVRSLSIDKNVPSAVIATVAVEPGTPVHSDTSVALDFQGLTGAPAVALEGGKASAPALPTSPQGEPPLLEAPIESSQSVTDSARATLRAIDQVLSENSKPLKEMVGNLDTFSAALARNSDRVDGILSGLEKMAGGGKKKTADMIADLTAPIRTLGASETPKLPALTIAVQEPTALENLDTEQLNLGLAPVQGTQSQATQSQGTQSAKSVQWADALPRLMQTRLIQGFENWGLVGEITRPMDGLNANYQIAIDIRRLAILDAQRAVVELSARIVSDKGKIIAGRVFGERASLPSGDASNVNSDVTAIDQAFGKAATALISWAIDVIAHQPPPASTGSGEATNP